MDNGRRDEKSLGDRDKKILPRFALPPPSAPDMDVCTTTEEEYESDAEAEETQVDETDTEVDPTETSLPPITTGSVMAGGNNPLTIAPTKIERIPCSKSVHCLLLSCREYGHKFSASYATNKCAGAASKKIFHGTCRSTVLWFSSEGLSLRQAPSW